MTDSGTASSTPRAKISAVVRFARAVADGGNGSWSIPSACLSAGVVCCWTTNPPSSTSGSQTPPFLNAVACTSTSSPRPPAVGFSWHSPQAVELKRGPSPFSGVNTLSNTTLPRAKRRRSRRVSPRSGSPGLSARSQAGASSARASRGAPFQLDALGNDAVGGEPAIGAHDVAGPDVIRRDRPALAGDVSRRLHPQVHEAERVPDARHEIHRAGVHGVDRAPIGVRQLFLRGQSRGQKEQHGDERNCPVQTLHASFPRSGLQLAW